MFFIILKKLIAAIALRAVYYKQIVYTNSLILYIYIKVLWLLNTKLIYCLAVVAYFNYLFARQL
jgi:hypothetical protein